MSTSPTDRQRAGLTGGLVLLILAVSFAAVISLPTAVDGGQLTHDLANVDIDPSDFGRILNEVRWNGVAQTARFQATIPPPINLTLDEHSALTFYHDQDNANHTPGDMNIPDAYFAGEFPDDYQVTTLDQPITWLDDTPSLQRSRASYTNKGLFTFVADDVRVTQTAFSVPGSDWVLVEYQVRNINATPITGLRVGFHGYISGRFPGVPPLIPPTDMGGPGGDGGDEIDSVVPDGGGFAYRVSDNLGSPAATTLLFRSGNPTMPLTIYHGESYSISGGFDPARMMADEWLHDALLANQLAYPGGSGGCAPTLVCNVRTVVGWDIGVLPPGEYVRLPLAICLGGTQAAAAASCDLARGYWQSVNSGFLLTEVQDEGAPRLEFYNWNKAATGIAGWYFSPDGGATRWNAGAFSCGASIPTSGHCVYTLTAGEVAQLQGAWPEGASIGLYDAADALLDAVAYGQSGLAPDPLDLESSARFYSSSAGEYSGDWTRSPAPSFGAANAVPPPDPAMRTPLNEVFFNSASANRFVEIYYGGAGTANLAGYRIVLDAVYTIPPGPASLLGPTNRYYYLRESTAPAVFTGLAAAGDNVYLYDNADRLLDRAGWSSPHAADASMVRLPDGSGTPGAHDDPTATAAGWVFDQRPTTSAVLLEADASQWGDPGRYVWYSLNATNRQTSPDHLDLVSVSEPMNFPVAFFQSDQATPLADSAADGDGVPDTGLLPAGSTFWLWARVWVRDVPAPGYYKENTSVFAVSSLDPLGADRAYLETLVNPWIDPDASADPTTIFVESAAPLGLNTISTVTLNASGRGFVRYTAQDVLFTIDSSGSMSWNDPDPNSMECVAPHPERVNAALSYIANLSLPDRGGYVDLDQFPTLVTSLTTDYATLSAEVSCSNQMGGTLVSSAMLTSNQELSTNGAPDHVWVVILLTDAAMSGQDDGWSRQAADAAAAQGIIYYTIGLNVSQGPPGGSDLLGYVANTTGGNYYPAPTTANLQAIFADIFARVRNLAGKDIDVTDTDPMIQFVLSDQVNLVPGSFQLVPGSQETDPNPDLLLANPTNVTMQWNQSSLDVGDFWAVTFQVTAPNPGPAVPVNVLPDSRVSYLTFENHPVVREFPLVTLNVLPAVNLITPEIRSQRVGDDLVLTWALPAMLAGADAFAVYGGPAPRAIDLTTPLGSTATGSATAWVDPGRASLAAEFYYVVSAVNVTFAMRSLTSNTAGFFTVGFGAGLNAFSLPLEPYAATDTAAVLADLGATSLQYMDGTGAWRVFPVAPNVPLGVGRGLLADIPVARTHTFVGFPGSMIVHDGGAGFTAIEAGSLQATVSGGDVQLTWAQPTGLVDHYCVRRSTTRDGFHTGASAEVGCTVPGDPALTAWSDPGAAVTAGERYYLVVPVLPGGANGSTSYSIGIWTAVYSGVHAIGLPLRPSAVTSVDAWASTIPGTLGILWFATGTWVPHFTAMPAGTYDALLPQAAGVQIQVAGTTAFSYIGT